MIEVSRSSRLICLIFLVLEIFLVKSSVKSVNERRKCTYRSLLIENSENEQLLANLFYPLQIDNFFRSVFELQPTIVQNRNPAFYSKLIDLNVIGQYLESQDLEFDGTFETARQESPEQHAGEGKSAIKVATARTRKHGVDWKLVKRVWRNGDWWCSSPNVDVIPLHVVRASFQSKGYSIVINKMQEFHHPLKVVTSVLENIFGCRVNANVYLTPSGAHQAFESHFDWMDGIIVQVIGCKTWIIDSYPTAISPMPDTVFKIHDLNDVNPANSRDKKRRNGRKPSDVQFLGSDSNSTSDPSSTEFDLSEGSLLYIPRGFTHQAATNCSRRTFDSTGGSTANTAGFGDVASIHVTFGLEAVTDSTVEIFLHHYISLFFDIQEDRCDVLDDENSSSRFTQTDGLLDSSDARCRARVPPRSVTNSTSALPLLKISLLNQRDNSTFHIEDMSKNDLAHLILHSAATSDSRLDAGSSETAVHLNAGDNRTKGKQQIYRMDPSVLRQAVATTTFIARNGYQPMIGDLLPLSLKYLSHYLTKHTATEVIYHAILLGTEMHLLKAKRTGYNSRDNYEPKGGERASGEFKDPESSKKLNYITRFMTSDPVVSHESRIAEAESDGKAERSGRQGDKGINELRLLLISGEWMIVPGSSESAESAEEFFMAVFSGLAEEDEADIVEMESGIGGRNADNTEDLFCPSWRRMTDALRASTADGP